MRIQRNDGKALVDSAFADQPGNGVDGAVAADGLAADVHAAGGFRHEAHQRLELCQHADVGGCLGDAAAAGEVFQRIQAGIQVNAAAKTGELFGDLPGGLCLLVAQLAGAQRKKLLSAAAESVMMRIGGFLSNVENVNSSKNEHNE